MEDHICNPSVLELMAGSSGVHPELCGLQSQNRTKLRKQILKAEPQKEAQNLDWIPESPSMALLSIDPEEYLLHLLR